MSLTRCICRPRATSPTCPNRKGDAAGRHVTHALRQLALPSVANTQTLRACAGLAACRTLSGASKLLSQAFAALLTLLLAKGQGLWVGPDCDGLLNHVHDPSETFGRRRPGPTRGSSPPGVEAGPSGLGGYCAGTGAGPSTSAQQGGGAGAAGSAEAWAAGDPDDPLGQEPASLDLSELLAAVEAPDTLPAAVAPNGVRAHPKHFQLQGLEWMLRRERDGDALGRSLLALHPAWLQLVTACGTLLYVHR